MPRDELEPWQVAFVVLLIVVGLGLWFISAADEDAKWNAYKAAQHCHVEGKIAGHWVYARRASWDPEVTLWRCDDGQLHGRAE